MSHHNSNIVIRLYHTKQSVLNTEGTLLRSALAMTTTSPRTVIYIPGPQYVGIQRITSVNQQRCDKHYSKVHTSRCIKCAEKAKKTHKVRLRPEIYWVSYTEQFYQFLRERWRKLHYRSSLNTLTTRNICNSDRALALVDINDPEQGWTCKLHTRLHLHLEVEYEHQSVEDYHGITAASAYAAC